jgi:hypothetical protein
MATKILKITTCVECGPRVDADEYVHRQNKYRSAVSALKRIAKPALGGKQQQYDAQAVLLELGEEDRST